MVPARIPLGYIILILGALSTLTPFAIDLYLPSFPQIAADMHSTVARVSLSVSSYFVGFSLGQVLYGPLLDRFGRKKPLYAGLALFILASIGCLASRSVEALIACRLLQALGGCAAQVGATAMVLDFFPLKESAKIFSLLMLILGVSPLFAPTAGSFIAVTFGWRAVFIVLIGIALALMAVVRLFLPEPHVPDPGFSLRPMPILRNFAGILKEPQFYTYCFAGAFSFSGLLVYVTGSPGIFMDGFHVGAKLYGAIFALLATGFIGSNQINIALLRRHKSERILTAALIAQVAASLAFLVAVLAFAPGLYMTTAFLFIILSCQGMANPNAAALALAPFQRNAGSASALLGFLQIGIAAAASSGVGLLNAPGSLPVVIVLFVTSVLGLGIYLIGRRNIVHEADAQEVPPILSEAL